MILAHVTHNLPIGLFLMAAFVREVPRELEEAALVDGCGPAGVFFRIVRDRVRRDGGRRVFSILPALVLLLLGQRFIVRGLTAGALK